MKYINIALLLVAIFCFFMPEDFHFHEDGKILSYDAPHGVIKYNNDRNIETSINTASMFSPTYEYVEKNGFKTMYTYKWYSCSLFWFGVCLTLFVFRIALADDCSDCPVRVLCKEPETINYKITKFFGK